MGKVSNLGSETRQALITTMLMTHEMGLHQDDSSGEGEGRLILTECFRLSLGFTYGLG